jgi:uncharacterized repeat protein (TIGR02543 family)
VIVPEGSKQLTGQALADATVNIIDPVTGDIIATTTTDVNGYYQVFVPAGGPYLLQAVKNNVKVQQFTPQVEVGIEYDLGTADCSTTAVALIVQAMLDAEDFPNNLADINLTDIEADPDFNDVMSIVCSTIEAGEDPALSAVVQQAVEDFLYPPAPAPTPTPTYTVTFDSQGGSAVDPQTVKHGRKATEPPDPTKTGHTFGGWYKESGCTNPWDFDTDKVTSDVTLYAQWTINTYTVTFDKNGGDTEADPMTKPATHGGNVGTLPIAPTRTGYTFAIWNTKADGSGTEFTATTAVTADLTVYAQWTINTYTVTFNSKGGSAVDLQRVEHGGKVTRPTAPRRTGYTFGGWYKEYWCTDDWVFDTDMVTSDVTIYAKWTGSVHNITQDTYYTTIQAALDDADTITITPTGNTIEVSDGTYTEDISFPSGKVIVLQSVNGRDATIIEGDGTDSVVTIMNCTKDITLDGFTITVGDGSRGGGIYIYNSSPVIQNNTISGNTASVSGGGICIRDNSSPVIQNNTISGNTASVSGGGICITGGSSPTIQDNTISGNTSSFYAGGIYIYRSSLTIQNNTISGNIAYQGGGICIIRGSLPTIQDNTILGNTAYQGGGGIYIYDCSPTIQNNTISGNTASVSGGDIYIESGSPTIGGANESDTGNFNNICGNTPDQINPDSYPNNYIFTNCDVIGETGPAGGLIFYDKTYVSDGWRYLEAAPSDQSTGIQWYNGSYVTTNATGTAIGTGQVNTTAIVDTQGAGSYAAQLCDDLTVGVYSDWFLPSQDELNLMYENLHDESPPVGSFTNDYYWSSSESEAGWAVLQTFNDGTQGYGNKSFSWWVRAVRAF